MKCDCIDIEMGSYDNQIEVKAPEWSSRNTICLDTCIADEVQGLWKKGIITTGSCCGHNKVDPMINVIPEMHKRMVYLGYDWKVNQYGVKCYYPLSMKSEEN